MDEYIFSAYYVAITFGAAMVPKALGACIVTAVGISAVYPNVNHAGFIFLFFVPAILIAAFRD